MHPIEQRHLSGERLSIPRLLLETGMIVFGVLLALGLESWHEHRKQEAVAHQALVGIRSELAFNVGAIEAQLPKQREVLEGLQLELRELDTKRATSLAVAPLRPPLLTTAAWQAAMATQALSRVDLGTIQAIAGAYEAQRWMSRIEDRWVELITAPSGESAEAERHWLGSMQMVMAIYGELEQALVAKSKAAMARLPAT